MGKKLGVSELLKPLKIGDKTPEGALSDFMKVDPKRVEERLELQGVKKPKKKTESSDEVKEPE